MLPSRHHFSPKLLNCSYTLAEVARITGGSDIFLVFKVKYTAFIGLEHQFIFSPRICLTRVQLLLHQAIILFEFVGEDDSLFWRVVNRLISLLHAELNGRLSHFAIRKRIIFFKLDFLAAAGQA